MADAIASVPDEAATTLPAGRRAMVTLVVMAATLMVVLDTTIANVALPHMQAALGATSESVAWVLTSYIVASAIAMPVTGWLSDRFGRRALFTVAVGGFTITSALCGVSTSLGMMVGMRLAQGVFGAFLVPMSQAIMYDINPPEKHAQAMTIWGMGIMVGPIMGPVLGGYLTDSFDWRWVFFINVPIGIVTTFGAWALMTSRDTVRRRFDIMGFTLLALALGSFQLFLDRGTQLDWFQSPEIIAEAGMCVAAAWMFVVHSLHARSPIVPLTLFADRNYATALAFITVTGGILMAGAALVAPMLQRLLDYPVYDAGVTMMPRGVGTMVSMLVAGRLSGRVDARIMIFVGMLLIAWSLDIMTGFNLEMGAGPVLWSGLIQGLGLGLVVMPMNLLAFATLAPKLRTEGAALYSLMRNIGGSVAISLTSALMVSNLQTSHSDIGSKVTAVTMPYLQAGLVERLGLQAQSILAFLDAEVNRQALMIAYLDDFWIMMWAAILAAPLVMIMRPAKGKAEHIGE